MKNCAIVTGGTRGIGKAIALDLAKEGYNLVVSHVSVMSAEAKETLINEFKVYDSQILVIQADSSKFEDCQHVIEKAIEEFNTIEVLVNNAGITKDNLIMKMSSDDFQDVVNINLTGSFNMIKAVQRHMIKKKYGRIINIVSVIAQVGNVGQANYAASKAGVIALSKSAALELASRNITVNCVAPGFIETDMTAILDDKIVDEILKKIPTKKLGNVADVANVVKFLASSQTSYITGQVINVCGGMVM